MKTRRTLVTSVMLVTAIFACSDKSHAGDSVHLFTKLFGKGAGAVHFDATSKYRHFEIKVQAPSSEATLIVTAHRKGRSEKIAWLVTGKRGKASIELDTRKGHVLPMLQPGDTMQVWIKGTPFLWGTLEEPRGIKDR